MHHSGFPPEPASVLVGDASFWINLVAIQRADLLLRAFGAPLVITDVALAELARGRPKGRSAADQVNALVRRGVLDVVRCTPEDEELFMSLVVGAAAETLDDGEAATLVYAARQTVTAVIDERKATALAAVRFPNLRVRSTIDLLLENRIADALGLAAQADAVFDALKGARMRVPAHRLEDVAALIGFERVKWCPSLPAWFRESLEPSRAGTCD